jgi:NTE family protein
MKKIHFLLVVLLVSTMLQAQNGTNNTSRLKVGVVLGGGGARGASHIGVLKYIEEMGIPVDYVAGTSMGSIIGGFYALGYTPEELTDLIAGINWSEYIGNKNDRTMMSYEMRRRNSTTLFDVPFNDESFFNQDPNAKFISQLPSAYVNNSSLVNLFNDLCVGYQEEMDFNDLPIPFACVATDLVTGKEMVLRSGNVPTAMRASMAIPGLFSPVKIGKMVLVDGGLVNNFPADVLREMGADIIIGVEVTSTKDITSDDLNSLPQVLTRLVTNTTSAKRVDNREMCDVHIIPDMSGFGMLSFEPEAIDIMVSRGYERASEFHDQLLAIKQAVDSSAGGPVSKTLQAARAKNLSQEPVLIRSINIDNVSDRESRWLLRKGGLKVVNSYTQADIEHAMKIYRGTGCFDEITYQVLEVDSVHTGDQLSSTYDLNVNVKPAMPHILGLGMRFDTEEGAAILLSLGLNEKKFNGSKFHFDAKLSYNPRLNFTYTYSRSSLANFNVSYDFRNEHFKLILENSKGLNLAYQQHKVSGYISQFHLLNISAKVGLSFSSTTYDLSSVDGDDLYQTYIFTQNKLITPYVDLKYDNLDDDYFANQGIMANLTASYHIDPKEPDLTQTLLGSTGKYLDLNLAFQSYITPKNGKFTIIPQVYARTVFGSPYYFNLWNVYGGEIAGRHFDGQLPFIGGTGLYYYGDQVGLLRCDLRYHIFGNHYLTGMYNTLFDLTPLFQAEFNSSVFSFKEQGAGLRYSYNSPLGPVSLTAHWSKLFFKNHFGVYFSFGYTF